MLATSGDAGCNVQNSANDPLVPKLRDLLRGSDFSQLELRIDGQSQSEQHFNLIRQNVINSLEQAIDVIKKSSLR